MCFGCFWVVFGTFWHQHPLEPLLVVTRKSYRQGRSLKFPGSPLSSGPESLCGAPKQQLCCAVLRFFIAFGSSKNIAFKITMISQVEFSKWNHFNFITFFHVSDWLTSPFCYVPSAAFFAKARSGGSLVGGAYAQHLSVHPRVSPDARANGWATGQRPGEEILKDKGAYWRWQAMRCLNFMSSGLSSH